MGFEKFTMNPDIPRVGFAAHPSDQIFDFLRKCWSSRLPMTKLPCPEQSEAFAMAGNDRFGLDDRGRVTIAPDPG